MAKIPPELMPFLDALAEALANDIADKVIERLPKMEAQPKVLTTKEAAAFLKCSRQFLEIARVKGGGPKYSKVGRMVRYSRPDLEAWLAKRSKKSTSA